MSDLTFYTNPMSRGRIARWMLEEIGVPYQTIVLDYAAMKSPDFVAINPMGKVPTIVLGTDVVTEAAAICAYLADAFPAAGLAPPPRERAAYYRWLFLAAGPLEAAITNAALGVVVPPERRRMAGYGCLEDVLQTIEHGLSDRDYCAGDRFSAADVYLGSGLGFGLMFGTIPRRPIFERYVQALSARPAAVRAREIDDALIAAAKA